MNGRALTAKFDGYASCPLLVGDGKVILAEFVYGGVPQEVRWNGVICAVLWITHTADIRSLCRPKPALARILSSQEGLLSR
jgi:hypothetical protein